MGVSKKTRKPAAKAAARSTARTLPGVSTSGAAPVWHGSDAIEMQQGSPEVVIGDDDITVTTLVFAGKRSALDTARPANGVAISGYAGLVSSTRIRPTVGDKAILTVVLKTLPNENEDEEDEALEVLWEIDWRPTEKPIASNPKLISQGSGTTQTVCDEIEAWRHCPIVRKRAYQVPKDNLEQEPDVDNNEDWENLTGESLKVCEKIAQGKESWLEFNPIIIRKSIYSPNATVVTGACGLIGDPPEHKIAGYEYLKSGDSLIQRADSKWERTETWQGSVDWDGDLYQSAT